MNKSFLFLLAFFIVTIPGMARDQVLMVVTSADKMSDGKETGLWLEEYAVPYFIFKKAGFDVVIASPKGGQAPVDKRSLTNGEDIYRWAEAIIHLDKTKKLSEVKAADFSAIFIAGGHGTVFDLPNDKNLQRLLTAFDKEEKIIAAVCHGPAGLVKAQKADGSPLIAGRKVTGFSNAEERALKLEKAVPFLLESRMRQLGGEFEAGPMWQSHIVIDGHLMTGQNPSSSQKLAEAVVGKFEKK